MNCIDYVPFLSTFRSISYVHQSNQILIPIKQEMQEALLRAKAKGLSHADEEINLIKASYAAEIMHIKLLNQRVKCTLIPFYGNFKLFMEDRKKRKVPRSIEPVCSIEPTFNRK